MDRVPERVQASVWNRPYSALERMIVRLQARQDRRNIPSLWFWRMLATDEEGGTSVVEPFGEAHLSHRRYAEPVPAHIYVDWSQRTKGFLKGRTETALLARVEISRAEVRRLGEIFEVVAEADKLVSNSENNFFYLPRPGDCFRFGAEDFELVQWGPPEFYGPTDIAAMWRGTAQVFRRDSASPMSHLSLPTSEAPSRAAVRWRG